MVNFYPNPVWHMPFSRERSERERGGRCFLHFWEASPPKNAKNIFFEDFLLCGMYKTILPLYYLHVTYLAEKRKTVSVLYFSPGFRIVEGKVG